MCIYGLVHSGFKGELDMNTKISAVKSLADEVIKKDLKELDKEFTKQDRIALVNSLATLNVLGNHIKNTMYA